MAILPEEIVVKDIEKYLKDESHWYMKTHGDRYGKIGIPDIIVCVEGSFVGLEVKRHSGGKQSMLQRYHQGEIRKSNGICEFVTDVEQVKKIIGGIHNERNDNERTI